MPSVHDVLRWANRTAVADEITRRGYRVSGETLNRWYRNRSEVPAIVERIVFELFNITPDTTKEAAEPEWVQRLERKMDLMVSNQGVVADAALKRLVEVFGPPERVADVESIAAELRRMPPPSGEAAPDSPAREDRDTTEKAGQGSA